MSRAVIIVLIVAITVTIIEGDVEEVKDFIALRAFPPQYNVDENLACPSIIPRETWGARSPKRSTYIGGNLDYVIIHETGGLQCYTDQACANTVKSIQTYHMNEENKGNDINYNFLVDQFGNVYEGRGWEYKGNHESEYNSKSVGIAIIGSYKNTAPSILTAKAIKDLINCGVRFNKINHYYVLLGHRQINNNDCPGIRLYEFIKTLPHWQSINNDGGVIE